MTMCYVIHNSDGDTTVEVISAETFLERIEEEYWGSEIKYLQTFTDRIDTNCWGNSILCIRGDIVFPIPKDVIVKHALSSSIGSVREKSHNGPGTGITE